MTRIIMTKACACTFVGRGASQLEEFLDFSDVVDGLPR